MGVYRGGSGYLLCKIFSQKRVYLIDTYTGIPEDDDMLSFGPRGHRKGDFSDTSAAEVDSWLRTNACDNRVIIQGNFIDDACRSLLSSETFCFVHLDADIIQSTRVAFDFFYDRLEVGGTICFDDYGWRNCPGVKPFVDTIAKRNNMLLSVFRNGCALTKPDINM